MGKIQYAGDVNIENGGYFFNLQNWTYGFVEVVQVTPCSEEGLADNCYWIDTRTININPTPERMLEALRFMGLATKELASKEQIVECLLSYGLYDQEDSHIVQVGAKQSEYGEPVTPHKIIKANASLYNYARRLM